MRSLKEDVCIEPGGQEGQEGRDTHQQEIGCILGQDVSGPGNGLGQHQLGHALIPLISYGAHGGENYRQNSHLDQIFKELAVGIQPGLFRQLHAHFFHHAAQHLRQQFGEDGAGEAEEEEDAGDGVDFVCAQDFPQLLAQ